MIKIQNEDPNLRASSRTEFKELFNTGKIQIKGQIATPSSSISKGITYVDISWDSKQIAKKAADRSS
ncbi:hypothetical protein ACNQKP_13790 [Bdellovibrio bacteriovorus]|uniref:hypothetical protein n=1 Tax=Bdellovibrio bacteriovorus TaxID=959 RepID=UPI003AA8D8C5